MNVRLFFVFICSAHVFNAQQYHRMFYIDSVVTDTRYNGNLENKHIPSEFKEAICIALQYYADLSSTHIVFRFKSARSPLAVRPNLISVFKRAAKRTYIVTLSSSTINRMKPILIKNLSFNAQIGVLGHELAHITYFNSQKGIYFLGLLLKQTNKKAMDKFEFNTDLICIKHGLGFQLLSWSKEVREKLNITVWGGANELKSKQERYMNPETINFYLNSLDIYSNGSSR